MAAVSRGGRAVAATPCGGAAECVGVIARRGTRAGGFGLLPPVSRFPRGRRNRAGDMGLFRRLAASLFVAIAASAFGAPALAQTTARMVEFETPSGTTGILKATWLAPTDANRVRGYHVRYGIVGSSGFHFRRVRCPDLEGESSSPI